MDISGNVGRQSMAKKMKKLNLKLALKKVDSLTDKFFGKIDVLRKVFVEDKKTGKVHE